MKQAPVNIKNKRATFDYELTDTYTAGIVLTGTEIKSIRLGKASLVDTFCYFANGELWVKNMHVAEYFYGSYNNHNARRERKLLLNKKELEKLMRGTKDPGFTIVPVRLFINEARRGSTITWMPLLITARCATMSMAICASIRLSSSRLQPRVWPRCCYVVIPCCLACVLSSISLGRPSVFPWQAVASRSSACASRR